MQEYILFINNNSLLFSAWVSVAVLLILLELRTKFFGPNSLSSKELTQLINTDNSILYDIRSSQEYNKGHITSAVNILPTDTSENNNIKILSDKINSLDVNSKSKIVMLVCKDGLRSNKYAQKIKSQGIKNISYLNGGMATWLADGLPVVEK